MPARLHPDIKYRLDVECQSDRYGAEPEIIVAHDTEGANIKGVQDLKNLGSWFDVRSHEASAHTGIDREGQSARYVEDDRKAWSCTNFNPISLNFELIGYAAGYVFTDAQVKEAARWCAKWALKYDIPVQVGKTSGLAVVRKGIVTHSSLGPYGGGHGDPGVNFPMSKLIRYTEEIVHELKRQN